MMFVSGCAHSIPAFFSNVAHWMASILMAIVCLVMSEQRACEPIFCFTIRPGKRHLQAARHIFIIIAVEKFSKLTASLICSIGSDFLACFGFENACLCRLTSSGCSPFRCHLLLRNTCHGKQPFLLVDQNGRHPETNPSWYLSDVYHVIGHGKFAALLRRRGRRLSSVAVGMSGRMPVARIRVTTLPRKVHPLLLGTEYAPQPCTHVRACPWAWWHACATDSIQQRIHLWEVMLSLLHCIRNKPIVGVRGNSTQFSSRSDECFADDASVNLFGIFVRFA